MTDADATKIDNTARIDELNRIGRAAADKAFAGMDWSRSLTHDELLAAYRILAPHGYLGSAISAADGGAGMSYVEFGALLEGISEVAPFLSNHSVQRSIASVASDQIKGAWLDKLLTGQAIGGIPITEPHGGSQVADVRTTLSKTADGLVLNGKKIWAVHTMLADVLLVLARAEDGTSVRVAVGGSHPSITREQIKTSGLRYLTFGTMEFDNTPVAEYDILSGDGVADTKKSFAIARALVGVQAVALARVALESAIEHLGTRNARGSVVTKLDLIRHRIGVLTSKNEASKLLTYRALQAIDDDDPACDALAAGAKAHATDVAIDVCTQAIELCGALGFVADGRLVRARDDVAMLAIADGTPIVNHALFGAHVIKRTANA